MKSFALKVPVKQIYAGGLLTTGINAPSTLFLLLEDGSLWGVGDNRFGQLGRGDSPAVTSYAVKVSGMNDIVSIAAGTDHLILVNQSGGAFAAGRGDSGQLATARSALPSNRSTFGSMVERIGTSNI